MPYKIVAHRGEAIIPHYDPILQRRAARAFDRMMLSVNRDMPEDFFPGIFIPNEILPHIQGLSTLLDIDWDIANYALIVGWMLDNPSEHDVIFPLYKFMLQQGFSLKEPMTDSLLIVLMGRISRSRFQHLPELQDTGGEIYGDHIRMYQSTGTNMGTYRRAIQSIIENAISRCKQWVRQVIGGDEQ